MRGVHLKRLWIGATLLGSSPHARGPRLLLDENNVAVRIIPACAGST